MRSSIQYSLARIGIFLGVLGILWLVGLRHPMWLLLASATLSMLISLFALAGLRDKFAYDVADRVEHRRAGKQARRMPAAEDAHDEDAEADTFR